MDLRISVIGLVVMVAVSAAAQTQTNVTTTTGGTAGTVPVFTTGTNIENSPITVSGGNVGIGTVGPVTTLDVTSERLGMPASSGSSIVSMVRIGYPDHTWAGSELNTGIVNDFSLDYPAWLQSQEPGNYSINRPLALNPNGGNLGIGTLSPATALDVTSTNFGMPASSGSSIVGMMRVGYSDHRWAGTELNFGIINNGDLNYPSWLQSQEPGNYSVNRPFVLNPNGGNVGIGTTTPGAALEVNGSVKLTANSGSAITFQDGTAQSTAWTGVLCGGDYAESVNVSGDRSHYGMGDLLVADPDHDGKFLKSSEVYSTAVLGVYSTKPGALGRRQSTPRSADEVPMAMIGIVPTKVSAENGAIRPGDLLVASSTPGYAMKGTDRSRMLGAVIGKALGHLDAGQGVIEVGVTLQ